MQSSLDQLSLEQTHHHFVLSFILFFLLLPFSQRFIHLPLQGTSTCLFPFSSLNISFGCFSNFTPYLSLSTCRCDCRKKINYANSTGEEARKIFLYHFTHYFFLPTHHYFYSYHHYYRMQTVCCLHNNLLQYMHADTANITRTFPCAMLLQLSCINRHTHL